MKQIKILFFCMVLVCNLSSYAGLPWYERDDMSDDDGNPDNDNDGVGDSSARDGLQDTEDTEDHGGVDDVAGQPELMNEASRSLEQIMHEQNMMVDGYSNGIDIKLSSVSGLLARLYNLRGDDGVFIGRDRIENFKILLEACVAGYNNIARQPIALVDVISDDSARAS